MAPALLVFGIVDLPDEVLELAAADLGFWARELGAGHLPHWNPYKLGGVSVFCDPTCLAPGYPLGWLLPVLPLDAFILFSWVLHLALGAAGAHTLTLREGGSTVAACVAGALLLSSTTFVSALVDGQLDMVALLAWLPWSLVFLRDAFSPSAPPRCALRSASLGGACLGLLALGSHPRFASFAFLAFGVHAVALWLVSPQRPSGRAWVLRVAWAIALGTLLGAFSVLPASLEVLAHRAPAPDPALPMIGQALSPAGLAGLVYPRALIIDERWYHLGVGALLLVLRLRGDPARQRLLLSSAVLVFIGMGLRGPFGPLLRPVLWLFYPVETGAAAMAAPLLAVAVGLSVDRIAASPPARAALWVGLSGAALLLIAHHAAEALYYESVASVHLLDAASLLHGGLALSLLVVLLALGRRLGPSRFATALAALLLLDGFTYAWRVEAAVPSVMLRPSRWLDPGPVVQDLPRTVPPGRILQLPLVPNRDFAFGAPADPFRAPGHGWGLDPSSDPVAWIPWEVHQMVSRPLRRNAGSASGWAQVGGRGMIPPMPWSLLLEDLAEADLYALPDAATDPARFQRLLSLLHVRWVVATAELGEVPALEPLDPSPPLAHVRRFAVRSPRPPASLLHRVRRVSSASVALRVLAEGPIDLEDTVLLVPRDAPAEIAAGSGPAQESSVQGWGPGRWDLALPAHDGGVLLVAERYHLGWRATDGEGVALRTLRGNLVELGVVVPEGVTSVHLEFVAPGARAGVGLALLGVALLGLGLGLGRRQQSGR